MANEFKVKKGLIVNGSGSTVLDIQGSQGQLFSVTDQLSGSLFSVNDISGIPVMEVFSDDTINMGTFGAEAIVISGSTTTTTDLKETVDFGGGTGLTPGDLLYLSSSGDWTNANATSISSSAGLLGIALDTSGSNGVLLRGKVSFSGKSYEDMTTVGAPLYISTTSGGFTETAPTGTGEIVRVIGYVVDTTNNILYFCPDNTSGEV